jgi:hypothetical protein
MFPVRYGLYLCVPYGSHSILISCPPLAGSVFRYPPHPKFLFSLFSLLSKHRLFPQTALTGWAL